MKKKYRARRLVWYLPEFDELLILNRSASRIIVLEAILTGTNLFCGDRYRFVGEL
jgi:hypothetical protein